MRLKSLSLRLSGLGINRPVLRTEWLGPVGAVLWLAIPLSLGWHPVPTLGSLAEAVAVACVAALLVIAPAPKTLDLRRLVLGTGGVLGLLLLRCALQAASGEATYAGFWLGPLAVLATALLICVQGRWAADDWLRAIAAAVMLAALVNALVGFLQYYRIAAILDFLGPHWVYWDRSDNVAHGNVAQRNVLASLCLLGMAASIYLFPQRNGMAVAAEGLLAYVVALTASRTPWLILALVLLMALLRGRPGQALANPFVRWFVLPLLIAQILAPPVNRLLLSMFELAPMESAIDRLSAHGLGIRPVFYRLAAEIGLQSGLLGLGWKAFPAAMVELGYRQGLWGSDELPTHAHNLLLQLWVENGLVLALLASAYPIWLLLRRGPARPREDYARLSLLVLLVHSWLEFPLWQPAMLFLCVAWMCTLERAGQTNWATNVATRLGLRALAALLAMGAALTAWQLASVATHWSQLGQTDALPPPAALRPLRMNPVVEPYADWLELNLQTDTPMQRVARLERLARWLPDSAMLGLLADAYRSVGRFGDARHIDARRRVVFGVGPAVSALEPDPALRAPQEALVDPR